MGLRKKINLKRLWPRLLHILCTIFLCYIIRAIHCKQIVKVISGKINILTLLTFTYTDSLSLTLGLNFVYFDCSLFMALSLVLPPDLVQIPFCSHHKWYLYTNPTLGNYNLLNVILYEINENKHKLFCNPYSNKIKNALL